MAAIPTAGPSGEQRKRPLPSPGVGEDRHAADGHQGEQEAERGLERQRGAAALVVTRFGHHRGELGAVGDDGEPPHQEEGDHDDRRQARTPAA